jgi:hypothetical protein
MSSGYAADDLKGDNPSASSFVVADHFGSMRPAVGGNDRGLRGTAMQDVKQLLGIAAL